MLEFSRDAQARGKEETAILDELAGQQKRDA
jgi:hypothetical protein